MANTITINTPQVQIVAVFLEKALEFLYLIIAPRSFLLHLILIDLHSI